MILLHSTMSRLFNWIRLTGETLAVITSCGGIYLLISTCGENQPRETFRGSWGVPPKIERATDDPQSLVEPLAR